MLQNCKKLHIIENVAVPSELLWRVIEMNLEKTCRNVFKNQSMVKYGKQKKCKKGAKSGFIVIHWAIRDRKRKT